MVQRSNNLQRRSPNSSESVQMHYISVCSMISLSFMINITGRIHCPEGYHGNLLSMPWKKGTGCSPKIVTSSSWGNSLQYKYLKHESTPLTFIHLHITLWWPWKGPGLEPQLPLAQYKSYPLFPSWKFECPQLSLVLLQNRHCPPPISILLNQPQSPWRWRGKHSHKMLEKNLLHCVTPPPCCTPPPKKSKSAFLTRVCFPCTIHLIMQYKEPFSEWSCWRMFIETWPHSELTFRHRASSI